MRLALLIFLCVIAGVGVTVKFNALAAVAERVVAGIGLVDIPPGTGTDIDHSSR